jgi:hypothetical protein
MEIAFCSQDWTEECGLPTCREWRGPISKDNCAKVRACAAIAVIFAATSQHKTVPYKYTFERQATVNDTLIWVYRRRSTTDVVLLRDVPTTPIVVTITVTDNGQILGHMISGRLVFVHTINEAAIIRAAHIRPLVDEALVGANMKSRFQSIKLIDDLAFELKGNRIIAVQR